MSKTGTTEESGVEDRKKKGERGTFGVYEETTRNRRDPCTGGLSET